MCGIAGVLDGGGTHPAEVLESVAEAMTATLAHRGPDDVAVWVDADAGVALGHRRLAIIDLSPAGAQPMISSCGRHVLSYNGELYNHRELRRALQAAGRSFRGHSDSEVLLEAIAVWGLEGALEHANGMFALALWERHQRRLLLARDRLGEKPLYHARFGNVFLFGSELKALRAHPAFRAEVDRDVLALYLRLGYVPAPHSIYRNVRKLPPGCVLSVRASSAADPVPYWSARSAIDHALRDPFTGDEAAAADEVERLLIDAVDLRREADVPLGAFLSGGVDSSTVVALMQRRSERPVRTFTVRFPGEAEDEAQAAAAVARHLGTDHVEIDGTPEQALDAVSRVPMVYDEPFADPSQLPTMLLCAAARRHVTVAVSGDGGDEIFGGYNRHVLGARAWNWLRRVPRPVRAAMARGLGTVPASFWVQVGSLLPTGVRPPALATKAQKLTGLLPAKDPAALFASLVSQWHDPVGVVLGAGEAPAAITDRSFWSGRDPLEVMMLLDTLVALPDDMLVKVDRASMAVGLEVRVPLLDHRLLELAWRLPASFKVRDGQGKWILRQVLHRHVPRQLVDRPKTGFDPPLATWLRGPLRPWAESLIDERRLRAEGWLDPVPVRRRWHEHLSGRRNHDYALWTVLMFQAWLEPMRAPTASA